MPNRIKRKTTGVAPTAQQDVDVREHVVDLKAHPQAKDRTVEHSVRSLEDAVNIAEELETGIATEGVVDNIMKKEVDSDAPLDEAAVDDVMRKYDRESNTRIWEGLPKTLISIFMALFSIYCIGMTLFSTALPETRLSLFLAFITIIGYLIYPANKKRVRTNYIPWYDIVLMVVGAGCFFYFAFNALDIINLRGRILPYHVVIGVIGILVVAELCRRSVGLPIIIVVGALLIYAFYYFVVSRGLAVEKALTTVVNKMFYSTNGIIGTPINVCYTYIVLFIIFGAFLERTGIAGFFISFANRLAGWSSGGPAKVAVISSALCGMVSGSSVGNTVTTGSVTIPMMKKTGFRPEFAGAVEAASSTGGQIMPPIMGAAAFLMAEYMGVPYIDVAAKAILPAVLYFTGIFITVHLEAKKLQLKGIPHEELPKWSYLGRNCYLVLPLVLLVWLVATGARTMAWSAAISIIGAILVGFINFFITNLRERECGQTVYRVFLNTVKIALVTAYDALIAGAKSCISVAVACAMAGLIAGCITVTGLAGTLINAIVNVAGDAIIFGLVLTMLCCIVLGMGVPTTANYCIMASTTAPILIQLGLPVVAAHFFVFYFGIVADITPPVALAAYAGSAIAKSKPMKTAVNATKLAIAAFLVPYIFAFNPIMLLEGEFMWFEFAQVILTAVVGLFGVALALNGYLFRPVHPVLRVILIAAGLSMMIPGTLTDVLGLAVIIGVCIFQWALSFNSRMDKDDMHYFVCRSLAYLYECTKQGIEPNAKLLEATSPLYAKIPASYWNLIWAGMAEKGLVTGVETEVVDGKLQATLAHPEITYTGIDYICTDTTMKHTLRMLKSSGETMLEEE
ncbi:MAG: TRAP transporter fused permease subunit [Coriobacteriales bacterium]|nr:TRAP transporter fused permease subunit [Coriobacteriales bacterium]